MKPGVLANVLGSLPTPEDAVARTVRLLGGSDPAKERERTLERLATLTRRLQQNARDLARPPNEENSMSDTQPQERPRPMPAPLAPGALSTAEPSLTYRMAPEAALQPQTAVPPATSARAVEPAQPPVTPPPPPPPAAPVAVPQPAPSVVAPAPRPPAQQAAPTPRAAAPAVPSTITVLMADEGYGPFFYVVSGGNPNAGTKPLGGSEDPESVLRVVAKWIAARRQATQVAD